MFYDISKDCLKYDDVFYKEVSIKTEEGEQKGEDTYFLSACDDNLLKELGFAKVEQEEFPNFDSLKEEIQEIKSYDEKTNIYRISYKITLKSLQDLKELKKQEIDSKRDEAIESGVSFKNKIFQSAEKDRNLLTSTVSLFSISKQLPQDFVWIAKDNSAIPMSLEDLIMLGSLMAQSVNLNTIKARELKDRVELAKNKEELELITWEEAPQKSKKRNK
ncbi:hypothetical protein B6S12_05000 [Helicobacter valdiviensis]|uniref:DUF4376 domain-containing protein n=1 Tax=Helicobacter valdiviensis TaxID=1458358 RepID=A0A2W6NGS7_9HELI|nr:DUF4376 domain-containing protein [Helicobacter valdiviensis]PZT48180.1 hypothetical protein B6S12_05000 [Helicobacter valdiviensis]